MGETIELLADVLTFDVLTQPHAGPTTSPSAWGHSVEKLISKLTVASGFNFPDAGIALVNFGKGVLDQRQRITSIVSANVYELASTASYPTTGYPYVVYVGDGRHHEERLYVTNNNTGTNRLTFTGAGALQAHSVGEYVRFTSGTPEAIEYSSKTVNDLELALPITAGSAHVVGETVSLSSGESLPDPNGFDFAFFMPPDPLSMVAEVLDWVRAAGVRVTIVTNR
jgi:hypothetical protein